MPYLLDGDNLIGTAQRRPASATDREALVAEVADRLRRTRATVVLFFDGAGRPSSLGTLAVRFAAPVSADEAILRQVGKSRRAGEATVVTADRELSRRARDAGASVMSPADFWKKFGTEGGVPGSKFQVPRGSGEVPIDVEDWERWFETQAKKKE
jgi:YacP-like NYN domain